MAVLDQPPAQFEFATFNSLKIDSQGPKPAKVPFLFIVKTPESDALSRSTTRSAAASINSHAQRWAQEVTTSQNSKGEGSRRETDTLTFEKCMMRCRVSRLLDDPSKPTKGKRAGTGRRASKSTEKRSRKPTPQPSDDGCSTERKGSLSSQGSDLPLQTGSVEDETLNAQEPVISPSALSLHSALPPFQCTSIPIDSDVQMILQYFLSVSLQSTQQRDDSKTPLDGATVHAFSTVNNIIQGCMCNSMHMYSLLAATSSRMRRVSDVSFRADNGPEIYLYKALQCMRMLFDTSIDLVFEDRQIILDILQLSMCAWYMDHHEESRTHFNVLKHFWKVIVPGQSTLDQFIYDSLSYNSIFLESETVAEVYQFASLGSDLETTRDGEIYSSQPEESMQPHLRSPCSALSLALEQAGFSPDLKSVVQDIPSVLILHAHISRLSNPKSSELYQLRTKSRFLVLRLLEHPSYGGELCCRLALVILFLSISEKTNLLLNKEGSRTPLREPKFPIDPALITHRLRCQLQYEIFLPANENSSSALTQVGINEAAALGSATQPPPPSARHTWTGRSDPLLLWILVTGFYASRSRRVSGMDKNNGQYNWFWTRIRALMELMGIATKSQLKEVIRSFVYVDGIGMLDDEKLGRPFVKT